MINIRKENLNKENIPALIELSHCWAEEGCSHGIVPNTEEDLKEPLYTAREDGKIVGYIFGHFYTAEKRTSYIEPGSYCFEVDEFYVLPQYRSRGIGRQLFSASPVPYPEATGAVTVTRFSSEALEAETTADRILALVRECGYRYSDIAIVASSLESYGPLLKRACRMRGIPLFFAPKAGGMIC